jgi:hypothetical protein
MPCTWWSQVPSRSGPGPCSSPLQRSSSSHRTAAQLCQGPLDPLQHLVCNTAAVAAAAAASRVCTRPGGCGPPLTQCVLGLQPSAAVGLGGSCWEQPPVARPGRGWPSLQRSRAGWQLPRQQWRLTDCRWVLARSFQCRTGRTSSSHHQMGSAPRFHGGMLSFVVHACLAGVSGHDLSMPSVCLTVTVTVTWFRIYLNTPLGARVAHGVPGS